MSIPSNGKMRLIIVPTAYRLWDYNGIVMWVHPSIYHTELSIHASVIVNMFMRAGEMSETWLGCKKKWVYSCG